MDFTTINIDKLDEGDRNLVNEIGDLFPKLQQIEMQDNTLLEPSKCYFVFSYNLMRMGLLDEGLQMLQYVNSKYYESQIKTDLEDGFEFWQEAENLKNQVAKEKIARRKYCQEQAEFVDVAVAMIRILPYVTFAHKVEFEKFLSSIDGEKYMITKSSPIGLVKE